MALDRFASWTGRTVSSACGASDITSAACGSKDKAVSSACGAKDIVSSACGAKDCACGAKDRF